jgi:hypothetical protein
MDAVPENRPTGVYGVIGGNKESVVKNDFGTISLVMTNCRRSRIIGFIRIDD